MNKTTKKFFILIVYFCLYLIPSISFAQLTCLPKQIAYTGTGSNLTLLEVPSAGIVISWDCPIFEDKIYRNYLISLYSYHLPSSCYMNPLATFRHPEKNLMVIINKAIDTCSMKPTDANELIKYSNLEIIGSARPEAQAGLILSLFPLSPVSPLSP